MASCRPWSLQPEIFIFKQYLLHFWNHRCIYLHINALNCLYKSLRGWEASFETEILMSILQGSMVYGAVFPLFWPFNCVFASHGNDSETDIFLLCLWLNRWVTAPLITHMWYLSIVPLVGRWKLSHLVEKHSQKEDMVKNLMTKFGELGPCLLRSPHWPPSSPHSSLDCFFLYNPSIVCTTTTNNDCGYHLWSTHYVSALC